MQTAHKIQIYPNNKQKTYLHKCFGISRFSYNWALNAWNTQYKAGLKPSGYSLRKEFNHIKREQFPWVMEVSKTACGQPFLDLEEAFKKFFKKKNSFPKFKKKGKCDDTCYFGSDNTFKIKGFELKLAKLDTTIKMSEKLRFQGKINSVTLSRKADKYFASIQVEIPDKEKEQRPEKSVGIDLGIKHLVTTSDGYQIENIKPLRRKLNKIKKLQRKLSKKQFNSNNFKKAKTKLAREHLKVTNLRKYITHKVTTFLAKNYTKITMEDLNTKGMIKNHKLALAIQDVNFGRFKNVLTYKCERYGTELVFADRFFPSSKTCNCCGEIKDSLLLSERVFKCSCGVEIDRDLNAAININKIGGMPTEFKPVEIQSLRHSVQPYVANSINEAGIRYQSVKTLNKS